MKKLSTIFLMSLVVLFCFSLAGCGSEEDSKAENGKDEPAIPVEVALVQTGSVEAFFSGTATLEVEDEAQVVAKVSGVVKEIFVEEGQAVSEGQVLARLDKERLAVLAAQAEANFQRKGAKNAKEEKVRLKNILENKQLQIK